MRIDKTITNTQVESRSFCANICEQMFSKSTRFSRTIFRNSIPDPMRLRSMTITLRVLIFLTTATYQITLKIERISNMISEFNYIVALQSKDIPLYSNIYHNHSRIKMFEDSDFTFQLWCYCL